MNIVTKPCVPIHFYFLLNRLFQQYPTIPIQFAGQFYQKSAAMNVLVAKPTSLIRFPDSKDVVDNQPNESRPLKTNQNLSTTAPVSPNHNTIPPTVSQVPNLSNLMSTQINQMRFEENRLKTFKRDWPHTFISPRVLAKTGFFYIGPEDHVRCFFCEVEVGRWDNGDNEVSEHIRWSPNCRLLKRGETSNVPLEPGKFRHIHIFIAGRASDGKYKMLIIHRISVLVVLYFSIRIGGFTSST